MSGERVRRTSYVVDVAAPAGVVYALLADTTQWPLFIPPSIHVERLDFDGTHDRFGMWATAGGTVTSWISRRSLDSAARTIDFHQEVPAPPATSMGGRWAVEERGPALSRLTLLHHFTVADDNEADADWIVRATDANSGAQLARLKETAERWTRLDDLLLIFEDSVRVHGPAELVYEFLYGAEDWPAHLPDVTRADVREDRTGVQLLSLDTRAADGRTHTAESVRVCFPHAGRIVFKETRSPLPLAAHTGEWSLVPDETGLTAVARHSVVLREEDVEGLLGPGVDLAQARDHVRSTLGAASTATLHRARRYAESAVRVLTPGR
ncbi:aromatase/cyclase [Streptomyces cirratus]|uniref:aromatase/cyclase n=1 Tax=Streptomyces cirratus TaxID=68187 RepID=UPI00167E9D99|nr:aromatase/cyclase [Streptomyces cirratus]